MTKLIKKLQKDLRRGTGYYAAVKSSVNSEIERFARHEIANKVALWVNKGVSRQVESEIGQFCGKID